MTAAPQFYTQGKFRADTARALFKVMDEDNDGIVTYKDFCKVLANKPIEMTTVVQP